MFSALSAVYTAVAGPVNILISIFLVIKAQNKHEFERINTIYKFIILSGIVSIVLV